METWKPVVGWEDRYEVSDLGRVRRTIRSQGAIAGRILKAPLNAYGYPVVGLARNGKGHTFTVHRLVAAAFLGPCPAKKEVNHKDGNPANSALTNLEYVTRSENTLHSYRVLGNKAARGSAHYLSKLKEGQVLEIVQRLKAGETSIALAARFGVERHAIDYIKSGRHWSWLTGINRQSPELPGASPTSKASLSSM